MGIGALHNVMCYSVQLNFIIKYYRRVSEREGEKKKQLNLNVLYRAHIDSTQS